VWFAENTIAGIGRITTSGLITEFTSGLTHAPRSITKGPDGNLWFTEPSGGIVGRLASQGGSWAAPVVTEYSVGAGSSPMGITAGSDGNVWFTDNGATPAIGRITPQGVVTEYSIGLTVGANPEDIAKGDEGSLWFTENRPNGAIGRITTAGVITEFTGATGTPENITRGSEESLWFTSGGNAGGIGRIDSDGTIKMFSSGLTPNQSPTDIVTGSNGWLYFTESGGTGALGSITRHGTITEYTTGLTPSSAPTGIAPGADGNIWFTENANPGRLGQLTLPPGADTDTPTGVTDTAATLNAEVTPNSQATTYHFEYGTSSAYGSQTPTSGAGSGASTQSETVALAALSPATTYHYRIVASNGSGTTYGPDRSFTTQSPPARPAGSGSSPAPATLSGLTPPSPAPELPRGGGDGAEPGGAQPGELTPSADEPPPVLGHSVVLAQLVDGVAVQVPGTRSFLPLSRFLRIPVGSTIDARRGKVRLTSATGPAGPQRQSGVFWGGMFKVTQTAGRRPETDLTLVGGSFAGCRAASPRAARAARSPRKLAVRSLWGRDHHGAFRTHGRDSVATVRGTKWLTQDRCDGTLTQVLEGTVSVRGVRATRSVLVRAHHRHLTRHAR
jgi:streptogramin lyase